MRELGGPIDHDRERDGESEHRAQAPRAAADGQPVLSEDWTSRVHNGDPEEFGPRHDDADWNTDAEKALQRSAVTECHPPNPMALF